MKPASVVDPHAETTPGYSVPTPMPGAADPLLGRWLKHFRVDAVLGHGGMGVVYRGWDASLERPVALKVLPSANPEARARFLREARAQARIRHPNVVPIHFVGEEEGLPFLAMDLIEGESLALLLEREKRLPQDRALDIVAVVARALGAAAAEGLVHRDIKPSNILLEGRGHCLLADFGLAKQVDAEEAPRAAPSDAPAALAGTKLTQVGVVVGTPAYMAPEQATGQAVDHRADIYALGVTLYEALTGRLPFAAATFSGIVQKQVLEPAPPLAALVPDLRPEVSALVDRMMQKRPEARFSTYAELFAAIERARARPLVVAGLVPRAAAFAIDFVLFTALATPLLALSGMRIWAVALAQALVMGLVEGHFGTSLGKRLMRLRIAGPGDGKPSRARALVRSFARSSGFIAATAVPELLPEGAVRNTLGSVLFLLWLGGFFLQLKPPRRTALHDRLTGTRVVYALA